MTTLALVGTVVAFLVIVADAYISGCCWGGGPPAARYGLPEPPAKMWLVLLTYYRVKTQEIPNP